MVTIIVHRIYILNLIIILIILNYFIINIQSSFDHDEFDAIFSNAFADPDVIVKKNRPDAHVFIQRFDYDGMKKYFSNSPEKHDKHWQGIDASKFSINFLNSFFNVSCFRIVFSNDRSPCFKDALCILIFSYTFANSSPRLTKLLICIYLRHCIWPPSLGG